MGVNMIENSFKNLENRRQNLPKAEQNPSKIVFNSMIAFRNGLVGMGKFVLGQFFWIFSRPGPPDRVPKFFKNRSRSGLKVRFCFSSVLKPICKGFWSQNGLTIVLKIDRKICGRGSDVENAGSVKNATPTTFYALFFISESYFKAAQFNKNTSIMMSKSVFVFWLMFGRFLVDFWSLLGAKLLPKLVEKAFPNRNEIWTLFGKGFFRPKIVRQAFGSKKRGRPGGMRRPRGTFRRGNWNSRMTIKR